MSVWWQQGGGGKCEWRLFAGSHVKAMFGVTISARGRKARSCENTGPHQQKKNLNYPILIWSVWWRGIRRPPRDNKITGRNKVSPCWSRFLFLICCEGGDIIQDQYLVPSRDQSRLRVLKALYRRSIPNTSATTYTTILPVSLEQLLAGWSDVVNLRRTCMCVRCPSQQRRTPRVRRSYATQMRPVESIKLECAAKKHLLQL